MSRLDERTLALLSGYAAGVLSAEEHAALMDAALRDQEVFDALADEEALRQLLADDAAKTRLLAALETRSATPWYRRPWAWTAAAVPVLAGMLLVVFLPFRQPEPQLVAEVRRNEAVAVVEAPAAPLAKSISSDAPVPAGQPGASTPAPSPLPPAPAQEASSQLPASSSAPASAGAASVSQERREEAKVAVTAISVSAPAPVQVAPPAAVQDAKRSSDESASALAVSSFRQEADLAAAPKQKAADLAESVRQKNEALAARDLEVAALKVEILARRSPNLPWSAVQDDSVASGDAVRLRITTTEGGELRIRPGDRVLSLRTAVAPIEVDLGTLPEGLQTITVSLTAAPSGSPARERTGARSAMTMGAVSNKPGSVTGEGTPVVVVRRIRVGPR